MTATTPYLSRLVVGALRKGGFHGYKQGAMGFKVYSFHGGTPHVQCYGARCTQSRQDELSRYLHTLEAAGFVCVYRGHMIDITGRVA